MRVIQNSCQRCWIALLVSPVLVLALRFGRADEVDSSSAGRDGQLTVHKELYLAYPRKAGRGHIFKTQAISYTSLDGSSLLELWHAPIVDGTPTWHLQHYLRRSEDNGRTWSASKPFMPLEKVPDGVIRRDNVLFFLDPDNGLLLLVYHKMHNTDRNENLENTINCYRISRDGGKTWEAEQEIIQQGDQYDREHWARDVEMGKYAGMIAGVVHMEKTADGTLLLPCQMRGRGRHFKQAVFLGKWRKDLSGIDWDVGEYVAVPRHKSSRGVFSGTVAPLVDGRIMLVMRGSSKGTDLPGDVQWVTVSKDGGQTWQAAWPLSYEDGSTVWSSSSSPRLLRSSKNGRLYLTTHIVPEPGFVPRQPLCIAEVDEDTLCIRRSTVTVISQKQPSEPAIAAKVTHEYRAALEDRVTGNLVFFVFAGWGAGSYPGTLPVFRCEVDVAAP